VIDELREVGVGVHFDENNLYTLDTTGALVLTILATVAEEESRSKCFIMNWSIERRFSKGIFLTPKLLGYDLDEDGELVINTDEAETVKAIFRRLTGAHLDKVISAIRMEKDPERKKAKLNRRYFRAALYNAVFELEAQEQAGMDRPADEWQ
jgi:hypothetical protein